MLINFDVYCFPTADLSALQIAIQDFGPNSIDIVFGDTNQDVVYEVSIDPGKDLQWKFDLFDIILKQKTLQVV